MAASLPPANLEGEPEGFLAFVDLYFDTQATRLDDVEFASSPLKPLVKRLVRLMHANNILKVREAMPSLVTDMARTTVGIFWRSLVSEPQDFSLRVHKSGTLFFMLAGKPSLTSAEDFVQTLKYYNLRTAGDEREPPTQEELGPFVRVD